MGGCCEQLGQDGAVGLYAVQGSDAVTGDAGEAGEGMRKCPKCGAMSEDEPYLYCINCGYLLTNRKEVFQSKVKLFLSGFFRKLVFWKKVCPYCLSWSKHSAQKCRSCGIEFFKESNLRTEDGGKERYLEFTNDELAEHKGRRFVSRKRCDKCNFVSPQKARLCLQCGNELSDIRGLTSYEPVAVCIQCGHTNYPVDQECAGCGLEFWEVHF